MRFVTRGLLIIAVLVAGFVPAVYGFLGAQPPKVLVTEVALMDWVDDQVSLEVTFAVDNPNDAAIDITAIRYEMRVNNQLIAKDWHEQAIHLQKLAVTEVTLPVTVTLNALINAAPDILLTNQLSYGLEGAVVIKDLPLHLPFKYSGAIPLLQ